MKMLPINCSPLFLFPASFLFTLLPAKKDIAGRRAELSEGRSFNSFASEKRKLQQGLLWCIIEALVQCRWGKHILCRQAWLKPTSRLAKVEVSMYTYSTDRITLGQTGDTVSVKQHSELQSQNAMTNFEGLTYSSLSKINDSG